MITRGKKGKGKRLKRPSPRMLRKPHHGLSHRGEPGCRPRGGRGEKREKK